MNNKSANMFFHQRNENILFFLGILCAMIFFSFVNKYYNQEPCPKKVLSDMMSSLQRMDKNGRYEVQLNCLSMGIFKRWFLTCYFVLSEHQRKALNDLRCNVRVSPPVGRNYAICYAA